MPRLVPVTAASLPELNPALIDALRADLAATNYTVQGVREVVGDVAADALDREQWVPAVAAARGSGEAAATLLRLFQLGDEPTRAQVAAALPNVGVDGLAALGLVTTAGAGAGDAVRATCDLSPYSAQDEQGDVDWWIASDPSEIARRGALPTDYVLGVGGASRTLAQLTVRDQRGSVLDVGTGCGIQALHASRHAARVVATDIDGRALGYAGLNAALAGVSLDLREGSMFEPVAGELFDLVVSNPPFVITPRGAGSGAVGEFTYRDGGASGDDVVSGFVRSVGDVLAPGGVAQLLGNWEHRRGEDWEERVASWLPEGLDGWVVQRELLDPAQYAELWLRDGGLTPDRDRARYEEAYLAWLADLASRDVEAIGFGFVTVRRPLAGVGPELAWHRVEEITGTVQQPLGAVISSVLDAVDDLRGLSASEVLGRRWQVAGDVTEERFHEPGQPQPSVMVLRAGGGLGRTVQADTGLAAFVGASDGELTGLQIVGALASLLEVDAEALAAELAPQVRGLATDGLLLPVV